MRDVQIEKTDLIHREVVNLRKGSLRKIEAACPSVYGRQEHYWRLIPNEEILKFSEKPRRQTRSARMQGRYGEKTT